MCVKLNEEQYLKLCETCDRVLIAPDSAIECIAISWLHVIREHPMFLAQYEDLFKHVSKFDKYWWELQRTLHNWAGWCWLLARSLFSGGWQWFGSKDPQAQIDFLFVSHLINKSQVGQSSDFYYGNVPNDLAARGHTVAIALINHTKHRSDKLVGEWGNSNVSRFILSKSLGVFREFAIHRRLKVESLRLSKYAKDMQPGLFQRVCRRASQEALSGGTQTTLRIGEQICALVAKHRPRVVVATLEGHAWERVVFAAARSAFPAVKCVGYQHAALFRMQHAIRRNLASIYNPDHILTAGTISKTQLEQAPELEGIPISVFGSNRSFKGGGNLASSAPVQKSEGDSKMFTCLVIPEGAASECNILFEFSLTCAQLCPDITFVWRLHPIVNFASLTAQNHKLRKLPGNIVLSEATLEADIARCRWALYRGSTAIVQSVVAGLRPIYLQLPDELTIDPLYELNDWRVSVASVSEFQRAILADIEVRNFPTELNIEHARMYCELLFTPFNVDTLEELIPQKFGASL